MTVLASEGRPSFRAVRAAVPPLIDGDLSDAAWQNAPEIAGFTQHDPDDGKPATQKTVVKVVFDDHAIYVGAMMYDTRPVTTLLGRRDSSLESDWFYVSIDSQHDGLNGASFWVNPSNVQYDANLYNDIYDDSGWDAVWESAAKVVPGGWVAEMRIPFSQIRFPEKAQQTWGVNFTRKINKNNEVDRLVNVPKGQTGWVSRFADLTGLEGIHPDRPFELMPYAVTRSDLTSSINSADPFTRRSDYKLDGGLDVKYGLSSNLTLTGTINPDFGQVEVDPAVVNLGQFETFFPEKRPFFTEGAQIFQFGSGPANSRWNFNLYPPQFFYSRRIGRSPQGSASADYSEEPGQTTILGAAKLSGKFGNGWSIGVLDAVTDRENGRFESGGTMWSQAVEPMTNYLVARSTKEYGKSSRVGILFTAVNRRLPAELLDLRRSAYELGVDGYTLLHDKDWIFEWLAGTTGVAGTAKAIDATQTNSSHLYNRPDADHLHYDPSRTSLSGFGGRAMLGKQTGKWRPNIQVQTYSPGFDVNDVGYMQRVDIINTHAVLYYDDQDVRKYTREVSVWAGKYQNWNYGSDLIANGVYGNWYVQAKNYWYTFGSAGHSNSVLDDRKTRGGPLAIRPGDNDVSLGFGSDSRKKFFAEVNAERDVDQEGGFLNYFSLTTNYRPNTAIRLSFGPSYTRNHTVTQYVTTIDDPTASSTYGHRYIFATLEQRSLDFGTRVEWTVNARLSFQLFLQPFIASGGYHQYKQLARPRSRDYISLDGNALTFEPSTNSYRVSGAQTFNNPDFNLRSVRGSAVVRWEFRPGSALYLVWNENRSDVVPVGDFRLRRDFSAIPSALSKDVFLVKVSYWLPI
ncbi:MAG TPA: DUF5916 domain-containing protein [Thermoanaerobaculia bacterium]|nr:DUF5916 domain-containing protein [Thermoanaerobaculia bacterium]